MTIPTPQERAELIVLYGRSEQNIRRDIEQAIADAEAEAIAHIRKLETNDRENQAAFERVKARVRDLEAENTTLKAVIADDCETEAEARKIAASVLGDDKANGDSHGVPNVADLMEMVVERLRGDLGKLLGVVETYISADPMVKGEAFRELDSTARWIRGQRDDLLGWPACWEKAQTELKQLRGERREWQTIESAPKDTYVFVWSEQAEYDIAKFVDYDLTHMGRAVKPAAKYRGWINEFADAITTPTHYMPLPPRPEITRLADAGE